MAALQESSQEKHADLNQNNWEITTEKAGEVWTTKIYKIKDFQAENSSKF